MGKTTIFIIFFVFTILLASASYALELPPSIQKITEFEQQLAAGVTFFIAFLAGIISFTSPCGFALLPAYFSFSFKNRKESLHMTSAFSLGLLLAFVLFGIIAGLVGEFFNQYKLGFSIFAGLMLIFFGSLLFLNKGFAGFHFENNVSKKKTSAAMLSYGFFFGAGWTPCIGPVLAGIILLGANLGNIFLSALLLGAYALGAMFPLLIISAFADKYDLSRRFSGKKISFSLLGRNVETHTYNIIGGIILVFLGLVIILYRGTFFFQTTMLNYIPWSMEFWAGLNQQLMSSALLKSTMLNIIIGALLLAMVIWMIVIIKNNRRLKA